MLRLITKNSPPTYEQFTPQYNEKKTPQFNCSIKEPFLFDFREISPGIYIARFRDSFHELACEITLELKSVLTLSGDHREDGYFEPVLAGDFPYIETQRLQKKVLGNDYLHHMTLLQFQLKILEQILLFCDEKDASSLILNFNEANLDYLEIYDQFITSQDETISDRGEQTEAVIATDVTIYDELIDFIDKVDRDFQRTLWREQRNNPILRQYLKSQAAI